MSLLRRLNPWAQYRRINGLLKIVKHLNEGCQKYTDEINVLKDEIDARVADNACLMMKLHDSVIENNKLKAKYETLKSSYFV